MSDPFTKTERSKIMSLVRSRGNKATELAAIKLFRQQQIIGWRRNYPLLGKPDFVFPAARLALFVDGCFWHSCPMHRTTPATNQLFWERKLRRNKIRDTFVTRRLQSNGWRVLRIWQHDLSRKQRDRCAARLRRALKATSSRDRLMRAA
jgi:DNA mismatch endonuclease (patch repair protein)